MPDTSAGSNGEKPQTVLAFRVGEWIVEPPLNRVTLGERAIHVRRQLMDLLAFLATRQGQVVSKEEIFQAVWPGQFVAESGLARCISQLRDVFGDDPREPRFIETIPTRGYRLVAPVERFDVPAGAALAPVAAVSATVDIPGPPSAAIEPGGARSGDAMPAVGEHRPAAAAPHRFPRTVVAALVLVALAAAGYGAWRGFRPVSLGEQDTVLVSFDNRTGDAVFDDTLRLALTVQLEQSPYLRVVPEQRVREALTLMKRDPDDRVSPAVAMDMCQRVGARAVLTGSIATLGGRYVIGLEGLECPGGRSLARRQLEVDGKEGVLDALGRAVSDMRRRLGESVTSIERHDVPLAQATTASLEALQALSAADLERSRGRDAEAVQAYQRAIEADPDFALAHGRLGVHLLSLARTGEATVELKRAFALRDRTSAAERFYITSYYYTRVVRDPLKAVEALEAWRDAYPGSAAARSALADMYVAVGRLQEAVFEAREALRLQPHDANATEALVSALMGLERLDEAKQVAETLVAEGRANIGARLSLVLIAFARDDTPEMQRQLDLAASNGAAESLLAAERVAIAMFGGRMHEAEEFWSRRAERAAGRGDHALVALTQSGAAFHAALVGESAKVRELATTALAGPGRTPDAVLRVAFALALVGDAAGAEQRLVEYLRMDDVEPGSDPQYREPTRALIEMERGKPDAAIDLLAPLKPYELGFACVPTYVRGLAHMRAGRPREAAAEFSTMTAHGGHLGNVLIYPLAWLQLARARAAASDIPGARQAYERFLRYWKDADPDVPALLAARAELAALGR